MRKLRLLLTLISWVSGAFMIGWITVGFLVIQLSAELPNAQSIKNIELKVPLRVFSADNKLISEFGNERRKPISIDDIPQSLIDSVLASEDDGFYGHMGIDPKGLFRAALSNFQTGRSGQGASTITMQVARNFFLTPEKTYTRKIKEILLSIRLEQILTKNEILSLYLNKIFLGHRAYGFGAAAEVYYGKPLDELNLAQIAMLAGLPKAPSSYNPIRNPERAVTRRNYVLGRLKNLGKISDNHYQEAITEEVSAEKHVKNTDLVAPHIAEMVRAHLISEFGQDAYWQGLNVFTTIQSRQQAAANRALRNGLKNYDKRHGFRGEIGKIDLTKLKLDPNNPALSYSQALSIYPNSQEQVPALITSLQEPNAIAHTREFGTITLRLKGNKWARRHKSANRTGNKLKEMADILEIGDVVYIEPKVATDTPITLDNGHIQAWKLSQIPNVGGALISIEPSTGRVLSLTGGYDFFINKFNRATQSIRQPGSNIKPFIYSAAIEYGLTPTSLISGAPIVVTDETHGTQWRPENYSGKFFGPTRMRDALGKSMNLVSIRLLRSIGIPFARKYTERFGIDVSRFSPTLTMALGAGGIAPIEMLSAYTVLANGGYKVKPYFIERITDRNGDEVYRAPQPKYCDECYLDYLPAPIVPEGALSEDPEGKDGPISTPLPENTNLNADYSNSIEGISEEASPIHYIAPRVMSRGNNFLTVSMLKDVVKRGTARRALSLQRSDLAGKTGTTNDYVDAWFSGFNSKVATTVWVGFDKPATMGRGEAGSLTALPIWVDYMGTGLEGIPEDNTALPGYIEEALINKATGERTTENDPYSMTEYFVIDERLPPLERANATTQTRPDELFDPTLLETELIHDGDEGLLNTQESESTKNSVPGEDQPSTRIIETSDDETEGLF